MTFRPPTMRTFLVTLAALALFVTACGGGTSDATSVATDSTVDAAEAPAEPEPEAPVEAALVANTVSGGQIDFGSLEGQDVVLWFWAPW